MANKIRTCRRCKKPIDQQEFDDGMVLEVDMEGGPTTFVHSYDCTGEDDDQSLEERQ